MSKKPKQRPKQHEVEFMMKEYTGISKALGDLYYVILKVFHFYLLIAAFPFSIIAILYRDNPDKFELFKMPRSIAFLFLIISFLGFMSTLTRIHLRMEQILYARTINCIRRYFYDLSKNKIAPYLSLPVTDSLPPFFEKGRSLFWQIIIMGFIDSAYLCLGLLSLDIASYGIRVILLIFSCFLFLHLGAYIAIAKRRKKAYMIICPVPRKAKGNNY
ncbi:MAG: hypothetical protein WA240_12645 [Nitrospirota bacterium]